MRYSLFLFLLFHSCTYNELVPVCEPDEQIFIDLVQPIIEENCLDCHTESGVRPAILTTYDGVINAINDHALKDEVVSFQMPPYGSPPLSDSDISIITSWIDCE
tara:strand:+ start:1315 stop:1626 length:312 start_codon:yes stop_codon:yes gene_type:complete